MSRLFEARLQYCPWTVQVLWLERHISDVLVDYSAIGCRIPISDHDSHCSVMVAVDRSATLSNIRLKQNATHQKVFDGANVVANFRLVLL